MTMKSRFQQLNEYTGGLLVTAIAGGVAVAIAAGVFFLDMRDRVTTVEGNVYHIRGSIERIDARLNDPSSSGIPTRKEMELQAKLLEQEIRFRHGMYPPADAPLNP